MRLELPSLAAFVLALFAALCLTAIAGDEDPQSAETATLAALVEDLNLGFEASDQPDSWFAGGEGYSAAIDVEQVFSGSRSLRITYLESGGFGVATNRFPVDAAKGKRLQLSGFIKTEKITTGWAGLWMRVDGPKGVLAFDNMNQRGITGTTEWTRYQIELDVAEEAVGIFFGALLPGDGAMWVDSLTFELVEMPPPPPTITVKGVVKGPGDQPVEGAHVAFIRSTTGENIFRERSGAEGRFAIELPAGKYAVTATARESIAAYLPPASFGPGEAVEELQLTLGEGGITITGTVTDNTGGPMVGEVVTVFRLSDDVGDIFFTDTDENGRYGLSPVPGDAFVVNLRSDDYKTPPTKIDGSADRTVDFRVVRFEPAPAEVVAWIKANAFLLKTTEAESGFGDMLPLKHLVGDARVVALGEATHGTREFFQLKHRILEFLVEEMGFTVFAIEANWPECLAINDYVLDGRGDSKAALAGIYFWTWNTEEVLALIEWMRSYNADPSHETKLKFYGFDMQTTTIAYREVITYLEKVDPELATNVDGELAPLGSDRASQVLQKASDEDLRDYGQHVAVLTQIFDASRAGWVNETGDREWIVARQKVVLLEQALEMYSGSTSTVRDKAMAANLEWILETEPPGTKVVVWAHNGHVSRGDNGGFQPMGFHLNRALGDDYVVLGFMFNRGSFQAIDWTQGQARGGGLVEHTVGPAPEWNVGAAFARAEMPILIFNLRWLPDSGPIGDWFNVARPMRQIGAGFQGEKAMSNPVALKDNFDAIVFVDKTTRARPVE